MSSSPSPVVGFANRSLGWSIFLSILLILAGFFTLMLPLIGGIGLTIFVGWAMIFSGFAHLVYAWRAHGAGGKVWEILVGIVYLVAGFYLMAHPAAGLASLTLLLAFYLLFEGIFEIVLFVQSRSHSGSVWILFDGLITLLLAWMIWRHWPSSSVWAVGTLVGISMLFSGFSRLMLSLAAKRTLKAIT
jgi:uncharacterized membrane protein HdeD (DUF308 family)